MFTNEELQKLRSRIEELDKEYKSERKNYDILKQDLKTYNDLKNKAQREKIQQQKEFDGICALRFGHEIDLDNLSKVQATGQLENFQLVFKNTEKECLERIKSS